jgi:hypothetical protein
MAILDFTSDQFSAYGAVAAVVVAVLALLREMRHTTRIRQVDLMIKFEESFNSERCRADRLALCEFLQRRKHLHPQDLEWDRASPVIDFFEGIARYTRVDGLPLKFVHLDFFYWFSHYWSACRDYIAFIRSSVPMYAVDATWLYAECRKIDRKYNAGAYSNINADQMEDFLQFEVQGCRCSSAQPADQADS